MSLKSAIHWLFDPYLQTQGASWNCWYGCTRESPACNNCYISRQPPLRMAHLKFDKAAVGGKTDILYAPRPMLFNPLRWRKPLIIFVESLGDLWHELVPIERTAEMYAVMLLARHHIFITSTKRTRRMRNLLNSCKFADHVERALLHVLEEYPKVDRSAATAAFAHLLDRGPNGAMLPPANVWVGTTVEDNERAALRIPLLRDTPAAVRLLSCEPLTNELADPLDLAPWLAPGGIDWIVLGGESGPAAKATELDTTPAVGLRPIDLNNLHRLLAQADAAGAAPFVKQLGYPWAREVGAADRKGGDPAEWPDGLALREYPIALAHRALRLDPRNALALAVTS